jgi:hypothetical protein
MIINFAFLLIVKQNNSWRNTVLYHRLTDWQTREETDSCIEWRIKQQTKHQTIVSKWSPEPDEYKKFSRVKIKQQTGVQMYKNEHLVTQQQHEEMEPNLTLMGVFSEKKALREVNFQ